MKCFSVREFHGTLWGEMTTPPGRTAIIIGASSGIGEALARELNESVLDECGGADLQASSAVG